MFFFCFRECHQLTVMLSPRPSDGIGTVDENLPALLMVVDIEQVMRNSKLQPQPANFNARIRLLRLQLLFCNITGAIINQQPQVALELVLDIGNGEPIFRPQEGISGGIARSRRRRRSHATTPALSHDHAEWGSKIGMRLKRGHRDVTNRETRLKRV